MIRISIMVPYRKWFQRPKTSLNRYPVRCSSEGDPVRCQSDIKGCQLFSQTEGGGKEERVGLKRKIEMTRRISRSVTLCNGWVVGIHLSREKERENTPHGLQWDFSNYLLLHIWMRWGMRGLEACAALPPSENHLRGDFKNIPVMLQDKSLITGNYGLPISPLSAPPLSPKAFHLTLTTFILSFNRRSSLGEGSSDGKGEEGKGAITWEQTLIMAADALLHFHSCGVAHLWAAITDQMIQTGPCNEGAGLTEWLAALFYCACVQSIILCF